MAGVQMPFMVSVSNHVYYDLMLRSVSDIPLLGGVGGGLTRSSHDPPLRPSQEGNAQLPFQICCVT